MLMIVGTLAWALGAFLVLHDNAKTRRDIKSFSGQFDGNMKSFWARLSEIEKAMNAFSTKKEVSELARKAGLEDGKIESKFFLELGELRETVTNNVDSTISAVLNLKDEVRQQKNVIQDLVRKDLLLGVTSMANNQRKAKAKNGKSKGRTTRARQ